MNKKNLPCGLNIIGKQVDFICNCLVKILETTK